jgi:DivIVA domain-containing protein
VPPADEQTVREQMNGDQADVMDNLAPADWATADEIRRRRFTKVADGYSPDEVHDYLGHLAGTFATLKSQIADLRKSPLPVVPQGQGQEGMSDLASRMAGVLREAEEHAAKLRQEAEQEGARLVAEGRQEADRMLAEGRVEADRTVVAARKEAEASIAKNVEAARVSAEQADKALAGAAEQSSVLLATAHAEAERIRATAEQEAAEARTEADRRTAEAVAFRDTVLLELRGAVERVAAAAPTWPEDQPSRVPAPPNPAEAAAQVAGEPIAAEPGATEVAAGSDEDVEAELLS